MLQRVKQIICVIMGLVLIVSMDVSAKENCTNHNVNVLWLDSYDNVYEMGMEAEMVIRGKVIKQTSESDQSTVITQNEIEVLKLYKGSPISTVTVRQLGGSSGDVEMPAPSELPLLEVNEEYILFLKKDGSTTYYYIMGTGQGVFKYDHKVSALNMEQLLHSLEDSFIKTKERRIVETPSAGAKWRKSPVYFEIGLLNALSGSYMTAIRNGILSWNGLANIILREGGSDIQVYFSSYPGMGTAGYTNNNTIGSTIINSEITFYNDVVGNSTSRWQTVACHEVGHALGLLHYEAYSASVMYPMLENCSSYPQQPDIAGLQALY